MKLCISHMNLPKNMIASDHKFLYTEPHSKRVRISVTCDIVTPEDLKLLYTFDILLHLIKCNVQNIVRSYPKRTLDSKRSVKTSRL